MKKILGIATAICCMFALCFSLAGCGVDKSGYVGNWSLESGTDATLDADSIALMKTLGLQVILTLNDDETGSMDLFGDKLDVTWKATSATEGEATIDGKATTLKLEDDKLTVTEEDGKYLVFAKYDGELPSATAASAASASSASASSASASAASASAAATTTRDESDDDSDDESDDEATDDSEDTTYDDSQDYTDDGGEDTTYDETSYDTYDDSESEDDGTYYGEDGA